MLYFPTKVVPIRYGDKQMTIKINTFKKQLRSDPITRIPERRNRPAWFYFLLLLSVAWLSGCAPHMGVKPAGLRGAYEEINASALTEPKPGTNTRIVLHRYDLTQKFENEPEAVLNFLHQKAGGEDDRRDLRFALSELNFLYAEKLENSQDIHHKQRAADFFLVSAIYAYQFLLGDSKEEPPSAYDNRFREACILYNRALGKGLATGKNGQIELRDGVRDLPVGPLPVSIKIKSFRWDVSQFDQILCSDDFLVQGFTTRNRSAGMGLSLIAVNSKAKFFSGERVIPMTVFLRITGNGGDIAQGTARAELELYDTFDDTETIVNGRMVPLETDSTAPIAFALNNSDIWSAGLRRFFIIKEEIQPQLVMTQPYEKGRIPVVFVHGTASDMVWWMEMLNTLRSDPVLQKRYQFWFFRYNSSHNIAESAAALREILTRKRLELDPDNLDPAMDQMVVIGHSQGGLLTKLTVVRTEDKIWRSLSDTPLDQMDIQPEGKELIRKWMFVEPLPFVKRVIFISTPHRGSFLASDWIRNTIRRITNLPITSVRGAASFMSIQHKLRLPSGLEGRMPTSLDSMSPNNKTLKVLADIPIVPGVTSHSIIAVKDDGDPMEGDDGVVEYKSAHLDGVASEFIVHSEHSCQENPLTIEEVRRILLEHLAS
jgi:pimeloyl-ACP methyl ester carboxylesterase